MKIKILSPVFSKLVSGEIKDLIPCLSYESVYYSQGFRHKERKVYRKAVIDNKGIFPTGLIPRVKFFCKKSKIELEIIDLQSKVESVEYQNFPNLSLRSYQEEAVKRALLFKRGVIHVPTGGGKTRIAMGIASHFLAKNQGVLFIVHKKDLITQTIKAAKLIHGLGEDKIGVIGDGETNPNLFTVGMIQTLSKLDLSSYGKKVSLVITDECFATDTKVTTPTGYKKIQDFKIGDLVYSKSGINKVTNTFKNKVDLHRICKVKLNNGKEIFCSKDHIFFTTEGEKPITECEGKSLLTIESVTDMMQSITYKTERKTEHGMSTMSQALPTKSTRSKVLFCRMQNSKRQGKTSREEEKETRSGKRTKRNKTEKNRQMSNLWKKIQTKVHLTTKNLLFQGLLLQRPKASPTIFRNNEKDKPKEERYYKSKHESKQPCSQKRSIRKNKNDQNVKWNFTQLGVFLKRRKWETYPTTTANGSNGFGMGCGSSSSYSYVSPKNRLPFLLQNRCCQQRLKDSHRNRRRFSLQPKRDRQEKGRPSNLIWVESVTVYQPGSNEQLFRGVITNQDCDRGYTYLYDLEVEKDHNYFVEGVAVHNCHHCGKADGTYVKVLEQIECHHRIGLTATLPYKEEAKIICEGYIGNVISEVEINELTGDGILAMPKVKIVQIPTSYEIMKIRNYQEAYKVGIVERRKRNEIIAKSTIDLLPTCKTALVLVNLVDHGHNLLEIFKEIAPNIKSEYVRGATDSTDRETIKELLNQHKVQVVISTAVFKEGTDIPSLGAVVNAGGGKSEIVTLQAVGRGLRTTADKKDVILLDFFDGSSRFFVDHFGRRGALYCEMGWM